MAANLLKSDGIGIEVVVEAEVEAEAEVEEIGLFEWRRRMD